MSKKNNPKAKGVSKKSTKEAVPSKSKAYRNNSSPASQQEIKAHAVTEKAMKALIAQGKKHGFFSAFLLKVPFNPQCDSKVYRTPGYQRKALGKGI